MSLVVFVVVTFAFALAAGATRASRTWSTITGVGGLLLATLAAFAITPGEQAAMGGGELATTAYLRLFLVLGSLAGTGLAVIGIAGRVHRDIAAVTLATLGFAALTLGLADPRAAVLAGTAGALCGAALAVRIGADRTGATVAVRDLRAVVITGVLAIVATAWIGRDLREVEATPVAFGLAYLAVAMAVAVRFGAIPFHVWAARLTQAVPGIGLPVVTVLAAAPFAIVGLAWADSSIAPLLVDLGAERGIVLTVAVASIVLSALAALVQDDVEHIVGYSIVGDAGVALLALVALDPDAWAPARTWILALVVARSAFAAWAGALRVEFGTGRIVALRGWVIRAPLLAGAFGAIVVASVGVPGMAAADARGDLVGLAIDGPMAALVAMGTLTPILYYGRLLGVGLGRPDGPPAGPVDWRPRVARIDLTALGPWWESTWDANRGFGSAIVAAGLGLLALATSVGAFGVPQAAAGLAPGGAVPITTAAPSASTEPGDLEPSGVPESPVATAEPTFLPVPSD